MTSLLKAALLLSLLSAQLAKSQLSGIAKLAGLTNHAGITVKFTAVGGTAITDSCFTSATGAYSKTITGGLYSVSFGKSGYITQIYNNANPSVLTNTTVLQSHTLTAGTASYVSGAVGGVWPGTATYVVTGNLIVPNGFTLTIQPGATILFSGNYSVSVYGVLNALGTSSAPIRFSPAIATNTWNTFEINNGPSTLDHCDLRNFNGIVNTSQGLAVRNSTINNINTIALDLQYGSSLIENNDIINAKIGVQCYNTSSNTINCNRIRAPFHKTVFNSNYGITCIRCSDVFYNTEIWDCTTGIYVFIGPAAPTIESNYIHDILEQGIKTYIQETYTMVVNNNTFHKNGVAIDFTQGNTLSNNVITSCQLGVLSSIVNVDHNLFYNCAQNFSLFPTPPGLGQIVATNSNGSPVDSYLNLFINPNYATTMPAFQNGSPVFNAGNAAYGPNIGAPGLPECFASYVAGVKDEVLADFKLFPNPSNGLFSLQSATASRIRVFTISGIEVLNQQVVTPETAINLMGQAAGIYFCEVQTGSSKKIVKLVLL